MKFAIPTAALSRAGTPMRGRLARSLVPAAAGLALGALAISIIEPAPRRDARVIHPAAIEPAAGIAAAPSVVRFGFVPRPTPAPRVKPPLAPMPAWRAHAAAAPAIDGRPMIAIIIDDMGLDRRRSRRAVSLPAPLTLAYLPHASDLVGQTRTARARGHELLVHVSMEGVAPTDVNTLRPGHSADELLRRLDWSLGRFEGYVGVNNHMGSRFTANAAGLGIVIADLERRGLLFVDSRTTPDSAAPSLARATGVAFASRDVFLDHVRDRPEVEARLAELERIAARRGHAVAIGHPHRATIDALRAWIPEAKSRGFVLVPISAIVGRGSSLATYHRPTVVPPLARERL